MGAEQPSRAVVWGVAVAVIAAVVSLLGALVSWHVVGPWEAVTIGCTVALVVWVTWMGMLRYFLVKLLLAIPLLVGVMTLIFFLIELSPGSVADKFFTPETTPEVREMIIHKYGLDQPAYVRCRTRSCCRSSR